jgi:hypothetical protein
MRRILLIWFGFSLLPAVFSMPLIIQVSMVLVYLSAIVLTPKRLRAYIVLGLVIMACVFGYWRLGLSLSELLLALMIGVILAKSMEANSKRDDKITLLAGWVIGAISITYLEGLVALGYLLLLVVTGLAVSQATVVEGEYRWRSAIKTVSTSMLMSLPLIAILYLFVPRMAGPLIDLGVAFGLPITVAIDDSDPTRRFQAQLGQSSSFYIKQKEAPVLVAEFKTTTPYKSDMYWRGPIYWAFDGETWHQEPDAQSRNQLLQGAYRKKEELDRVIESKGEYYEYKARLLPNESRYLYALETPYGRSPETFITKQFQLVGIRQANEEFVYEMGGYLQFVGGEISRTEKEAALALPDNLILATKFTHWVKENIEKQTAQQSVMAWQTWLASGEFELDPTLSYQNGHWDKLFFDDKKGSVESLVTLTAIAFRTMGIPSRVVSGYQGGNVIALTNFVVVKNEHAHVWLDIADSKGGWRRFDPTDWLVKGPAGAQSKSAIEVNTAPVDVQEQLPSESATSNATPNRVTSASTVKPSNEVHSESPGWEWLVTLNRSMDDWIIHFDSDKQIELSQKMGLNQVDWRWLSAIGTLCLIVLVSLMRWGLPTLFNITEDPIERQFLRFNAVLAKKGLGCGHAESPEAWVRRLSNDETTPVQITELIKSVMQTYISLRFRSVNNQQNHKDISLFKRQIQQVKGML